MEILNHDTYKIEATRKGSQTTYTIGFGDEPADNTDLTQLVSKATYEIPSELHGSVALVTGKASLPVSYALSHNLGHYHKAVAVYDPKLQGFVVAITHDSRYPLGHLIES
jgi:hypothetical protein